MNQYITRDIAIFCKYIIYVYGGNKWKKHNQEVYVADTQALCITKTSHYLPIFKQLLPNAISEHKDRIFQPLLVNNLGKLKIFGAIITDRQGQYISTHHAITRQSCINMAMQSIKSIDACSYYYNHVKIRQRMIIEDECNIRKGLIGDYDYITLNIVQCIII